MTLSEFMRSKSLTDEDFASLVGDCSPGAVRKWKYGERTPRGEALRRIAEVTNGAVTANDFVAAQAAE